MLNSSTYLSREKKLKLLAASEGVAKMQQAKCGTKRHGALRKFYFPADWSSQYKRTALYKTVIPCSNHDIQLLNGRGKGDKFMPQGNAAAWPRNGRVVCSSISEIRDLHFYEVLILSHGWSQSHWSSQETIPYFWLIGRTMSLFYLDWIAYWLRIGWLDWYYPMYGIGNG